MLCSYLTYYAATLHAMQLPHVLWQLPRMLCSYLTCYAATSHAMQPPHMLCSHLTCYAATSRAMQLPHVLWQLPYVLCSYLTCYAATSRVMQLPYMYSSYLSRQLIHYENLLQEAVAELICRAQSKIATKCRYADMYVNTLVSNKCI